MATTVLTQTTVIHRVKSIIDKHCYLKHDSKSGTYQGEMYADYRDYLCDSTINKIFSSPNPTEAFDEIMDEGYMNCVWDYEDELIKEIETHFDDEGTGIFFDDFEDTIRSWVNEHVYFSYPSDHYLKQSVEVDIIVDTGDENYDYVLNCTYPHYNGRRGETVDDQAAIVWLAKQQGYTKTQLNKALRNADYGSSSFLKSIRNEVLNCGTHMNALTFFVKMTLEECLNLAEYKRADSSMNESADYASVRQRHGNDYIVLNKDTPCGLYDPWSGAGSILEMSLDKDVKLPMKFISTSWPDGCRGYGVGSIYGMLSSFWKSGITKIHSVAA